MFRNNQPDVTRPVLAPSSAVLSNRPPCCPQPGSPHLQGSVPFLAPEYAELWLATSRTRQQLQQATSPKVR